MGCGQGLRSLGADCTAQADRLDRRNDRGRQSAGGDGQKRQSGDVAKLIWNVNETIEHLSRFYPLAPGDLIFTGTPEGVDAVKSGDVMVGGIADSARCQSVRRTP